MVNPENGEEGFIYTVVFPEEVWKIILANLSKNCSDLLRCRLVCHGFKYLADEVLQESNSLWVPNFPSNFEGFLRLVQGTRFSNAEQVATFITEMEGNSSGTLFPNGTLIFAPTIPLHPMEERERNKIKLFYESFPTLVSRYGEDITSLVYYFIEPDDDEKLLEQLENIFKLPNLRRLTIHKTRWNLRNPPAQVAEMVEELKKNEGFQVPENLTELQILGESGFLPLAFIFSRLPPIMRSVTQLSFSFSWYCERFMNARAAGEYRRHLQMPKLESLKLWDPNKNIFNYFCQPSPLTSVGSPTLSPLKEISIKFPTQNQLPAGFPIGGKMAQVLRSLDSHSKTLRMLQLDIDEKVLKLSPNPNLDPPLDRSITYPKLTHLSIQFFTLFSWTTLMEELKEKFVNVEELTVIIHRLDTEGKPVNVMYNFLTELWGRLPPSLKVIRVPFYGWNLKRGETPSM